MVGVAEVLRGFSAVLEEMGRRVTLALDTLDTEALDTEVGVPGSLRIWSTVLVSEALDVEVGVPGSFMIWSPVLMYEALDAEVGVPGSLTIWSPISSTFMEG